MKNKNYSSFSVFAPCVVFLLFALSIAAFFYVFIEKYTDITYLLVVASIALEFFLMPLTVLLGSGKSKKSSIVRSVIAVLAGLAVMLPLTYLFNNILAIGNAETAFIAAAVAFITVAVPFLMHLARLRTAGKSAKLMYAAVALVSASVMLISSVNFAFLPMYYKSYSKKVTSPIGFSKYVKQESDPVKTADFYVSANGSDNNDGSLNAPFATIEKARDAVRALDKTGKNGITVAIMKGEYRVNCLEFSAEDSGTEACPITYCNYDGGEVVLNGGVTLNPGDFAAVPDEAMLSRLSEAAKKNVVCLDLSKYGITGDDYGKLYAIGMYNTAEKYDGDYVGELYSEVFFNDTRMVLARYPDNGDWLYTQEALVTGKGRESNGAATAVENWDEIRNPESDVYPVSEELTARISSWKTLDDVWMFGFWKYDWADASTPIGEVNAAKGTLSPKFVSTYGTKEGAPYYFYNVFEELTAPGEFYLDREAGVLYIYPTADMTDAKIDITLTTDNIIKLTNADYITFDGLTVKGTRSDGIIIEGNNNTVSHCLIKNLAGYAVKATGLNNLVSRNEITRTGRGGIALDGGDTETLTPGNNRAENNLIHDWSEIYQTYNPAVTLYGVGNVCAHNEMFNSPHEAVTYGGNNHIIEYNVIHDVCLLTNDGGAIYAGRRWDFYGNTIRYNLVYDLGSTQKNGSSKVTYTPDGIYLDDALSGQIVYGNLLVNVPKYGIHLGGGRDNDVRNNIIVNTVERPISYDDRARDGAINGGWFNHSSQKDGDMWMLLYESPWKTETWRKAYPAMTRFSDDFGDTDNPDFVPNPAYSTVTGNLIVALKGEIGEIAESAYRMSTIENNAVFRLNKLDEIFTSPENGDYSLKDDSAVYETLPDFENIPIAEIGIIN